MKHSEVRARRASIVDFIRGHERTTAEIKKVFNETSHGALMSDLKNLRHAGIIMRVAPATYALRAEADTEVEHPFVPYIFTDTDRWKCGIKKRARMDDVVKLYQSGTPTSVIAEKFDVTPNAIRSNLIEAGVWKGYRKRHTQ